MGNSIKLGIMGGTFDPIHTGHLIVGEMARQQFSLDKVVFIPAGIPPHKTSKELAQSGDRLEMVRLAVCDNPFFDVSKCEINRDKVAYTVDTLSELKFTYPESTEFYFIIGVDSLFEIKGWKNPAKLFAMCNILVYGRPGFDEERASDEAQSLRTDFNAGIEFVKGPIIDISSTLIREMIMSNMSIKYIVPDSVEEYIRKNCIYRKKLK